MLRGKRGCGDERSEHRLGGAEGNLPRSGGRGGIRRGEDAAESALPGVPALGTFDFVFDGGNAVEEKLADVGEDGSVAGRDAVGSEESEEFSEGVVDVAGGFEFAGEGGELGGNAIRFEELSLLGRVKGAERGMGGGAEHAALAAGYCKSIVNINSCRKVKRGRTTRVARSGPVSGVRWSPPDSRNRRCPWFGYAHHKFLFGWANSNEVWKSDRKLRELIRETSRAPHVKPAYGAPGTPWLWISSSRVWTAQGGTVSRHNQGSGIIRRPRTGHS